MRNRLIRYAVTQLGFKAVALETGLTASKRIYDRVLGKTTETEAALKAAFSYHFGTLPENLELMQWLRNYNAAQPAERQVHFYGIDITDTPLPDTSQPVWEVLDFVDHANPNLGRELHKRYADVISLFEPDKYAKLASAEKDAITAKIQDLIALIRRERGELTSATSGDEYEWVLRESLNAAQDDVYMRSLPPEFNPEQFRQKPELRDLAMADNLMWVQQREMPRGKTFFFAHDAHVSASVIGSRALPGPRWQPGLDGASRLAGMYLRSMLGRDMVAIGTWFGHGEGFPVEPSPLPPGAEGLDGLLSSLAIPIFIMDLREVPSGSDLRQWFQAGHEARNGCCGYFKAVPADAYDAILFTESITPAPVPKQ
jgi:erythromycin esterase